MAQHARQELTEQREEWFREMQEGLLQQVRACSALDPEHLREDLGSPRLIGTLLVVRIAVLHARGMAEPDICSELAKSAAFSAPTPTSEALTALVREVRFSIEFNGLACSVALGGLGLQPWSPESTYMLLLEYWAAQRGRTVTRSRVEQELHELWDTNDQRVLAALSALPAYPLEGYPDLWKRLKAEPDFRVGNAAAMALGKHSGADRDEERWHNTRTWSILKAGHLVTVGRDLVCCQAARHWLGRYMDKAPDGDEFRGVLGRAGEVIQEQLDHIVLAVEGMSAIEYELLRDRDADEHFQDSCLATFQEQLLGRHSEFALLDKHETTHGTWGPLPWWAVALHNDRERRAAEELLVRGGLQLRIEARDPSADELVIICEEPGLGPSGLSALLRFDLGSAVHCCELLLLARREQVGLDFVTEHIDEWDDRELNLVGSLSLSIGEEISGLLASVATRSLRRLVPGTSGAPHYNEGLPLLERLLKTSQPTAACRYLP
ncbi:hypothetical protein ACFPFX_35960 [Streptomyces mauvecolor]|uniref:Uncharacterized protein n=1 Tax=Streptomyces mauvecolor TaxID=58345 RepID=A0ABV9UWU1_9ACTN